MPTSEDEGMKSILWNEGILTLGFCFDTIPNQCVALTYQDTSGNIIWAKQHFNHPIYTFQGNDIIAFDDSTFYVIGMTYVDSINHYDAFFAKFDENGEYIFQKLYSDPGRHFPIHFLPVNEDSILVLSIYDLVPGDPHSQYIIWSVDSEGNTDSLFVSPLDLKYAAQLYIKNSRFYIGGERRTTINSSFNYKVFVDVHDSTFTQLFTWNPSNTQNEYFHQLFTWKGELHMTNLITEYLPNDLHSYTRLELSGYINGIYQIYGVYGPYDINAFWSSIHPVNDSVLVTVNHDSGESFFYFFDEEGQVMISDDFNHWPDSIYRTRHLTTGPNGGILGTGGYYPQWGISTDHSVFLTENIVDHISTIISVEEYGDAGSVLANVHPNPFEDILWIDPVEGDEILDLLVYDLSGKLLLSEQWVGRGRLNTEEFKPGIYLLELRNDQRRQTFRLIKTR